MKTTKRILFAAAILVILAANGLIYLHIQANRSGQFDSSLQLTEREMPVSWSGQMREDNSIRLKLEWQVNTDEKYNYWKSPDWLNEQKLLEIGFSQADLQRDTENRGMIRQKIAKKAVIVLEFDGPSYQEFVRRAELKLRQEQEKSQTNPNDSSRKNQLEAAEKNLNFAHNAASRLFAVDAGGDAETLRKRYPDRSKYLFVEGRVMPILRNTATDSKDTVVGGQIQQISIETIHVPKEIHNNLHDAKGKLKRRINAEKPGYLVHLHSGKRFEPWISRIEPIAEDESEKHPK